MWKPRKICCEKTINESNERTFERSTILRNNSHQTKSKSCVEWTMKVSVLVCCCCCLLLAVLHSASVCISLFIGHTRTFKHSLDVLCVVCFLCYVSHMFHSVYIRAHCVMHVYWCMHRTSLSVAFVLCSVANLMCYWNQFDFFRRSFSLSSLSTLLLLNGCYCCACELAPPIVIVHKLSTVRLECSVRTFGRFLFTLDLRLP